MTDEFLPFALPDIGDEEINAVTEALRSGWVTTGPKVKAFEEEFATFLGGDVQCIAVNSATAGLHLALEAIGVGPGDEVIVPSLTFTATAEVVRYLGADAVIVDVEAATLNVAPEAVRKAITVKTKAIIPVHYGGLACDMDTLIGLAREHGIRIVEDAAHALPTTCGSRLIGTLDTDVTVFSFYANKSISTGEGGMIVTKSEELLQRMKIMRLHGIDRDAFDRFRSAKPAWYYEVVAPGYKYNMTDIAAAMGSVQLQRLPKFLERRERLAEQYYEKLKDLPLILPPKPQLGDVHAWHLYVVRLSDEAINNGLVRDQVIADLAERGIGTSVHYIPLHRQPYWRDRYNLNPEDFPQTEDMNERLISLPLFTKMTDEDQCRVIDALHIVLS